MGTGKTSPGNGVANRLSIKGVAGGKQAEFSIKGEGGPATIYVNNLAPGTSANDVKVCDYLGHLFNIIEIIFLIIFIFFSDRLYGIW